ncbi:dynein regulatory complex protein 9 isoform X1 [Apus apus]|uniref:dynein regulatory complex protein 9 isoform X1 n=1 Tax=Apus apus TaxID=8895 RepID=UPI0021F8824F|nr:dynein regulatory complex protein 9 isoform X1 [Apus apus]
MEKLTHLEALHFAAVLEDSVEQLSILGYMMPVPCEGKADTSHTSSQEMKEITGTQKSELDTKHQKRGSGATVASKSPKNIKEKQQLQKTGALKRTSHLPSGAMKHSPLPVEHLRKIQADRQYASDTITATMKEMQESGTFNTLTEAVEKERARKNKFQDLLIREEEGKKEIKALKKQLQAVKKETEIELKKRDTTIAYLMDELQETKAKTDMEISYMKKRTDLQIHQTKKKCSNAENALDEEIQKLKSKTDKEIQVHNEVENFLGRRCKTLVEELEHWADKYENDMGAKDEELDALKASKANNLEKLQKIAKECQVFEETIISDRAEREARKKQLEQDALELKSILKLQAWWRGVMVRRNLGPYQALKKTQGKHLNQKKEGEKEKAKKKPR